MQVPQFNELRNRLGGVKAELRVVKNTLLRRALKDSNLPDLESYLHGQSAVVMGEADISGAAKILKNFTAEFQKPKLKVGILDHAVLEVAEIMALADLPSKDVLQAKLLGLLLAPATTLARLINIPAVAGGAGAEGLQRQGRADLGRESRAGQGGGSRSGRGSGARGGGCPGGRGSGPGSPGGSRRRGGVGIGKNLVPLRRGRQGQKTGSPVSSEALRS